MTKKKVFIMVTLTMILCIMTLGYAALQEQIDITGGASINSTYRVEITKIEQASITGSATVKEVPSYTGLTANFNVGLTTSSDSITYNIEISNLGTVDVRLNNAAIITEGSSKIKVTKSGIANGDILLAGESKTMTVKISYTGNETSEITGNININLEYTRLKGGTGEVVEENSLAYLIGDQITFAGSNWYVIKDSTAEDDYVTLMKETVLTNAELGEYAVTETKTCTAVHVTNGTYGCTTEGETVVLEKNAMSYYYSDTCHYSNIYGYTDIVTTGCEGHNDYAGSKVKEFLEGTYINTLSSDNLKEVDGYKIRLITMEELKNNLGWTSANDTTATYVGDEGNNVPTWVYQNFGDVGYWTTSLSSSSDVWIMDDFDDYLRVNPIYSSNAIRPVINLLKSSI